MSTTATFALEAYEHMASLGAFDGEFHKRVELIRGEILEMSPIGTKHAELVSRLHEWSFQVLAGKPLRVRVQDPIRIPRLGSEPEPDIVWVDAKNYSQQHPEPHEVRLIIEVADSSLDYDRGDKLAVYAEAGIVDYWIVNLINEQIEVYHSPSGGSFQDRFVHRGEETVQPLSLPDVSLVPSQLFS